MNVTIPYRFVVKRGTAAAFTAANTLLLSGEWALETDTRKMKVGDGVTVARRLRVYRQTVAAAMSQAMQDSVDAAAAFRRLRTMIVVSDEDIRQLVDDAHVAVNLDKSQLHELSDETSDLIVRLCAKADQYNGYWSDIYSGQRAAIDRLREQCITILEEICSLASNANAKIAKESSARG